MCAALDYLCLNHIFECRVEPSTRNSEKALFTINRSGIILIANKKAAELFSCQVCTINGHVDDSLMIFACSQAIWWAAK